MNKANKLLETIDLGPDIYGKKNQEVGSSVIIHCWDGRRFMLAPLPDERPYDMQTGEMIKM